MLDTIGLILAGNTCNLGELTRQRTVSAVPFGGRYRLIDFVLSSMVNSGIDTVGVACDYNYKSLLNHLGNGKSWDLARKKNGLLMLPPDYIGKINEDNCNMQLLANSLGYLRRSMGNYVVLTEGNKVVNIDFVDVVEKHIQANADFTIIYNKVKSREAHRYYCAVDSNGFVNDIVYTNDKKQCLNKMTGCYVFNKDLLISLVEQAMLHDKQNFVKDIVEPSIRNLKVLGYCFGGYFATVDSVDSLYNTNMQLFDVAIRKELFMSDNKILTKSKDRTPTRYQENAEVNNSMIADGCVIDGKVMGSIIGRGVHISKGAVVKDSIIMPDSIIAEGATVCACIMDKSSHIRSGKTLIGQPEFPIVVGKRRTV